MIARGALGNPWLFAQLLLGRERPPQREEVLAELEWTMARAAEHLGEGRAARYMRKFYPWYVPRLGLAARTSHELLAQLQATDSLAGARRLLHRAPEAAALAA
jgi:tRNA-dihydrouridine synthase